MGKLKVPGTERVIEFTLHETRPLDGPLFSVIGEQHHMDPEKFAAEFENADSKWSFSRPVAVPFPRSEYGKGAASAARFQKARSVRGRPFSSLISRVQDFAVLVLYFESLGYKQGTREARNCWERHGQNTPAPRHIENTLKKVRQWVIPDRDAWVKSIRSRYRLTKLPEAKPKQRR